MAQSQNVQVEMAKFCVFCIRLLCHPVPSDAARKMKRIEIIDQKVPGQKYMFAPVLSGVPGQMTRCPCGFGANAFTLQFADFAKTPPRSTGHGSAC